MDKHGRYAIVHLNDKPMIILDETGVTVRGDLYALDAEDFEAKLETLRAAVIQ